MPATSLEVEHLFTIKATTKGAGLIQGGPQGTRSITAVTGGTFEGARLKGTVAEFPCGDWITMRADGTFRLDVRLLLKTEDGALILMTYNGIGKRAEGGVQLRSAPQFETGDERYSWLNGVQAVGIGTAGPGTVTYEVYALS